MDAVLLEKKAKLIRNLEKLHDLIAKFKATVEGLFIHGSCSFWSVYGGLEKTQDDLWEILCFGLKRDRTEGSLRKELADLLQSSVPEDQRNKKLSLQDWINSHLLDYSMSVAISRDLIGTENHPIVLNLYEDYAAVRNVEILSEIVVILKAVEHNSLARLGNVSPWLVNKRMFVEKMVPSLNDEHIQAPYKDVPKSPTATKTSNVTKHHSNPTSQFYVPITPPEQASSDILQDTSNNLDSKETQIITEGDSKPEEGNASKSDKSVSSSQMARNVLMKSALAAVMESNEDDVIWYDEGDRFSLAAESIDVARHRLVHAKEISRSETSLFDEKVAQTQKDFGKVPSTRVEVHGDISSDTESGKMDEVHSDTESRIKSFKRPSSVKKGHSRSKSAQIGIPKPPVKGDIVDGNAVTTMSTSLPLDIETTMETGDQAYYYQPEDGYMFPKPYEGQSLISYLNSRSYDTGAELDKENAHFSICEALITAIEQMKCSTILDSDGDTSDEEIENLRQKIQERKLRKRLEKLDRRVANSDVSRSDTGKSSSSTFTVSSGSSSRGSSYPEDGTTIEDVSTDKLSHSWENLTLTTAKQSIHSEKSLSKSHSFEGGDNTKPDDCSAEAIAKSLLKKFSTHKLPAASELKWVVSEEEVPQSLLPFPTSWPVSPDDAVREEQNETQNMDSHSPFSARSSVPRFRGSLEWAPPRAQIVFVLHPVLKRKIILQKQAYRCAGCGLKVSLNLSKRFRYCEYFGKFFCTSCHRNQTSVIPARILLKWDFKKCPVSDFAFDLLKRIYSDPLFDVAAINPHLYKSIKVMGTVKDLSTKMHYIRNFLQTCRHTAGLCRELSLFPSHLFEEEQKFSLDDLVQIKRGELASSLKNLITSSVRHIRDCQLCKVKGFVCEFCKDGDDILYPFETNRVVLCPDCKTCYHRACFVPEKCPKCIRLKARDKMRESNTSDLSLN